jgi:hypothetical protein
MDEAFLDRPGHYELVYVSQSGTRNQCFGYQPRTADIAAHTGAKDPARYCIQLVGDIYEVYDLTTLKKQMYVGEWTIGVPVFTHKDPDAAIMWALMNL